MFGPLKETFVEQRFEDGEAVEEFLDNWFILAYLNVAHNKRLISNRLAKGAPARTQ